MTEFKVGDKVKYVGDRSDGSLKNEWVGIEGVVTQVANSCAHVEITKGLPNSKTYVPGFEIWPNSKNLELIVEEEPFTFKDIRKGDLIRRTVTHSDGSRTIVEGVAARKSCEWGRWLTEHNFNLAFTEDDSREGTTLELIERPKPKHWAETKPVGSIAIHRVKDVPAYTTIHSKIDENTWQGYLAANGKVYQKTVESLAHDLRTVAEDSDLLEWLK